LKHGFTPCDTAEMEGNDVAFSIPVHSNEWTVDDLDQFPESHLRIELHDGSLVVSPSPALPHQVVTTQLILALAPLVKPHLVIIDTDLVMSPTSLRRPDVAVIDPSALRAGHPRLVPEDVALAVEIVSPSSRATDRLIKPAEYAAAGIPGYWRIELEPDLRMFAYRLEGDSYAEIGSWGRGDTAELADPLPVTIEVSALEAA